MNKGFIFVFGLILGGAGGGLIARTILKQQYEQKADEEIAACRGAFLNELEKRRTEENAKEHEAKKEAAEEAIQEYSNEPEKAAEVIRKSDEKKHSEVPYVIPPEVFDDPKNPYPRSGLRYYSDGAIVRDDNTLMDIEDLDACVGREALTHFGEYEADRVCVRNEKFSRDYEIILFDKKYADILMKEKADAGK